MKLEIIDRTHEPLLPRGDHPAERLAIGFSTVIRDGDRWHLWYDAFGSDYTSDSSGRILYARSDDGVAWQRPDLGLISCMGDDHTNVVVDRACGSHVFLDANAPADERFKLTYIRLVGDDYQVFGATSPDGVHWDHIPEAIYPWNSDTQSVCFRDGDRYRLYVRMWSEGNYRGLRTVGYTESTDFRHFPAAREILRTDSQDPPQADFYNAATTRIHDGLYLYFPSIFDRAQDTVQPQLAWSADGVLPIRESRTPFLAFGAADSYDARSIYVLPGAIPTGAPDTWWIYYLGSGAGHDQLTREPGRRPNGIGRITVRITD